MRSHCQIFAALLCYPKAWLKKNRYNAQAEALIGSFAETINHNPSAAAMLLAIESRAAKTMSTLKK
jgi:hypothetical protein